MGSAAPPPDTLKALFEQSFARFGDRPAFVSMGVSLSYRELDRLSAAFGAFLRLELALRPGERVALMLPNLLQYPVAFIGALRAGLTVVNVNPLYTAAELQFQLADSGAAAIVVLENFAHTVEHALAGSALRGVLVTQAGDLFPAPRRWMVNLAVKRKVPAWRIAGALRFRDTLSRRDLPPVEVAPEDVALLQYTGGTTGRPKGAVLTHANLAANVAQTAAWLGGRLEEGAETVVTPLPLYHIFSLTANLLLFVRLGGRNLLIANPRDVRGLIKELRSARFNAITGVDTLYGALLGRRDFAGLDFSGLKLAIAGGMALQPAVAERWQRIAGVPLIEGYGLTEASPIVCVNPIDARGYSGKLGLPLPGTEVTVRDENGAELPRGETGEICVRGPQVMRGYWNAPQESAQAFFADGALRTGDIGRVDAQGWIEFVERRKNVIVVSGFKAYPSEIEAVALQHPGVQDAAAVGVPHPRSGEAVALFVVKRDPQLTAEALFEHCAQRLAAYKRPARIEFRDALPKSPIGKVLHRALQPAAEPSSPGGRGQPSGRIQRRLHAHPRPAGAGGRLEGESRDEGRRARAHAAEAGEVQASHHRDRIAAAAAALLGGVLVWAAPLAGLAAAGGPLAPYLAFPPRTAPVAQAPFSWGAFVLFSLPLAAAAVLYGFALARARAQPSGSIRRPYAWWGWAGLGLVALGWVLAWNDWVAPEWRRHTFTPLWLGYVLAMNALARRRSGRSLVTDRPGYLLALFPASALFWWLFEHLNRFVGNWYYTGIPAAGDWDYFVQGTLPFSSVLPAVASTWAWLGTFPRFAALGQGMPRIPAMGRIPATLALLIGMLALAGIGPWPQALFSFLWLAPLPVFLGLQKLFLGETLLAPLSRGDWRPLLQPAAAALVCGFVWELWNWGSLAQWHYAIPYVQRFPLFEMPLLGYAGYLPFGVQCAVVMDLASRIVSGKRLHGSAR